LYPERNERQNSTHHLRINYLSIVQFAWAMDADGLPLLKYRLTGITPHVIDTCLLISGLLMAMSIYTAFYTQSWLQAKILALVLYIVVGSIALKYGKTKSIRTCALMISWSIFIYIVMVARTHLPHPYI